MDRRPGPSQCFASLADRHAGGHACRVRRGNRAGAAGVRASGPRAGLAAVRRLVGARRLHRVALHAAGGTRLRPPTLGQAGAAAGRPDPGDGGAGRRPATGDDGVVLAAVLRLAVLPLPEAEPRHGGAGRVVAAGCPAPAGGTAGADDRWLRGHRRADRASRPAPAPAQSRPRLDVPGSRHGLRRGRSGRRHHRRTATGGRRCVPGGISEFAVLLRLRCSCSGHRMRRSVG